MGNRLRTWFRDPKFLLALTAALLAFVIQSGELGSADTMHRLQTAHSFWTSEPAVFPNEYPEFGVHGRGGKLYDWYGIGQALVLLPGDIVGTCIEKLPIFADYNGADPTVRNIFVTYTISILISILTALAGFRFLRLLEFSVRETAAGVLALLFCTTHLHYTQNMMENNFIFLLTLTGFSFQYEWLQTGSTRALLAGSAAFGFNLLIRLTTGLDLIAGAMFCLLTLWLGKTKKEELWARSIGYVRFAVPVYLFFLLIDRFYQFYRFGTWTDTYVHYFTLEHRLQDPTLPAKYPWETPFHAGFLGPLISPEKSIFLFDPLIILTIVVAAVAWKHLSPQVKAYLCASFFLVLACICFYARYTVWSGNFAWGDRYVSTAVEMAAFISVPILLKWRNEMGKPIWTVGVVLIVASLVIQVASLMFWLPLEIYQAEDFGHPQWVIWLRLKNIAAFALGKMDAWGLVTDSMKYDQWDYQHITTWNLLPFVLRRMGAAPGWVVDAAFTVWGLGIALLTCSLVALRRVCRRDFND
jgi:hypothetical protein